MSRQPIHRHSRHALHVLGAALLASSCTTQQANTTNAASAPTVPLSYHLQQEIVGGRRVFAACASDCEKPTPKTLPSRKTAVLTAAPAASASPTVLAPAAAPAPRLDTATVQFAFARAELSAQAQARIDALKPLLKRAASVRITAYTDDQGPDGPNSKLADARALAVMRRVRDLTAELGVAPKLTATGRPLCCYVAPNASEPSRGMNRRAEIVIEAAPAPSGSTVASNYPDHRGALGTASQP